MRHSPIIRTLFCTGCLWAVYGSAAEIRAMPGAADSGAFGSGAFAWTVGEPLIRPRDHEGDLCYSIKDPTIVRHANRWHLFCTIRGRQRTHRIEYLTFEDFALADRAERHVLALTDGYYCAPQVFYFEPRKEWYLIYQVLEPSREPALQPAFSTTSDLSDPGSWTPPKLLFDEHPRGVTMWIDFWVICDEERAYLFFTSHAGWLWRSETALSDFPRGWSSPEIALKGNFFEASHIYHLQAEDRYLALIEARADARRYYQAYTAPQLDGAWEPLAVSPARPFASTRNVRETAAHWTDSFSHGELLRTGRDQRLEVDPDNLRFLFQGATEAEMADKPYGEIPWKLSLLEPDSLPSDDPAGAQAGPGEDRFPYRHWTAGQPILTAGPEGSFDEVAVKDPSVVYFEGDYHVFYTSKPNKNDSRYRDGVGYVAGARLEDLRRAPRHDLNTRVGSQVVAPQIFYFRPHKLWYLIAQTPVDGPGELAPIYLTNPNLRDVTGWSKPGILRPHRPNPQRFWIDFWVICDARKAHLFYTDHAGSMFRMETSINRFPHGFANSPEFPATTVHGTDEEGPWRLHEASHIYHVAESNEYLALLEAVRPHPTRPNYWDSRNRFMFAMVADLLEGPWKRVERVRNDFMGVPTQVFHEDGSRTRYGQVSHGELIRAGYDERLEIEDYRLQLLFQAFDPADIPDSYDYDLLPWELAVMRNAF